VLLDELGSHHHAITTSSPEAQRYFDQGLALTYGFNHEAAIDAFREASRLDPGCAMCAWGEALALGPNLNAPMGPEAARQAYAAVQRALRLSSGGSPAERDYIGALATRYGPELPDDRTPLDRAYVRAMREVPARNTEDTDAATLLAEALMDLMPWNYWTHDARPRPGTEEALGLLEWVLAREPEHLGANHFLIHAVEEFFPERAEAAADRLGTLANDAGHLVHMPSHIYWRLGRYEDALEINRRATAADEAFFATCRAGAFYRAAYYPHNIHFLWAAAAAEGRSQLALTTARKLAAKTASELGRFDFMSEFMVIPSLTLARFGRWDAILGEARPDTARPYLTGIWHYTRGLARLRTGGLDEAQRELASLRASAARPVSEALILVAGTSSARALLEIAASHLQGELLAEQGRMDEAVAMLERAVRLQDDLIYNEPPPWYFPTRQALGAVLLSAGRAARAEAVYREDLARLPKNGWSLLGLAQSLEAQDKPAANARRSFEQAWARADVELPASRF
jgi:tetratricopeptide (TPR) repeat protein